MVSILYSRDYYCSPAMKTIQYNIQTIKLVIKMSLYVTRGSYRLIFLLTFLQQCADCSNSNVMHNFEAGGWKKLDFIPRNLVKMIGGNVNKGRNESTKTNFSPV